MPTDRPYAVLGNRLQALMRRANLNQPELATRAEISPSYPSKILSGEKRPSYPILVRMARALGADLNELAHLAGYGSPESDRPTIPGWDVLTDDDKALVVSLVSRLSGVEDDEISRIEQNMIDAGVPREQAALIAQQTRAAMATALQSAEARSA